MSEYISPIISLAVLILILILIPYFIWRIRKSLFLRLVLIIFYFIFLFIIFFISYSALLSPIPGGLPVEKHKIENFVTIKTLFATNRKQESNSAKNFTSERDTLKYGTCHITIPNNHKIGEIETPSLWRFEFYEDPEKHITIRKTKLVSKREFYNDEVSHYKNRILIFIHGYNVSFEEAAKRTGQMTYDLRFDGIPIFFSWPSKGKTAAYTHDSENIKYSINHIKRLIKECLDNYPEHEVHLIANSMGTRGLTNALIELYQDNKNYKERINSIILAAPDIDAQIFKKNIAPKIITEQQNLTLYSSSKDQALMASKKVNGYPRAGDSGKGLILIDGIETIDATNLNTGFLSHSYFGKSRSVISDIDQIIDHDLKASQRFGLEEVSMKENKYCRFRK